MSDGGAVPGEAFGPMLRRLRLAAGLTLEQLAEAAAVSDRAISDLERGVRRAPRVATMRAIADALRLPETDRVALGAAARAGRDSSRPEREPAVLPPPPVDFTGRSAELARVRRIVGRARAGAASPVVLLNGIPGIGKTSLALQAATPLAGLFPDGRYFVDLQGLAARPLPPVRALVELIRAVAPQAGSFPPRLADVVTMWRTLIKGRRLLVVLDNAADEAQVRAVLPPEGPAAVIVTSRRMLSGLEGVDRLHLASLREREAISLLRGVTAGHDVDAGPLREVARLCANVPLAVRIAGNRIAGLPPGGVDQLVTRLRGTDSRLDALVSGELQVSAAIALTYDQLPADARRLYRRLSLLSGSSVGAAVAALLAGQPLAEAEDSLDELVEAGLVQAVDGNRVRLHDLTRLHAAGRLRSEEPAEVLTAVRSRLRDWLLDTAVAAGRSYEPANDTVAPGPDVAAPASAEAAGRWLRDESDNWFGALAEAAGDGDHRRVVEVAESLHWFSDQWVEWGRWPEVFTYSSEAARRLRDDRLRATHLNYLAWAYAFCLNDPERGARCARQALRLARAAGDPRQAAWAGVYHASMLLSLKRYEQALEPARHAVAGFTGIDDREGRPQALIVYGNTLRCLGRHHEALECLTEALRLVTDPATAPKDNIARLTAASARIHGAHVHVLLRQWPDVVRVATEELNAEDLAVPLQHRIRLRAFRAQAYQETGETAAARADLLVLRQLQIAAGDDAGSRETNGRLGALGPGTAPGGDPDNGRGHDDIPPVNAAGHLRTAAMTPSSGTDVAK